MKHADTLELKNRTMQQAPVVVVVTRKKSVPCDGAVRMVEEAARRLDIDALAFDADEAAHRSWLDEVGVDVVPMLLVFQRGALVQRVAGVRSIGYARLAVQEALARVAR